MKRAHKDTKCSALVPKRIFFPHRLEIKKLQSMKLEYQ